MYLKQPGILYDMMFALKLRFNGERAYIQFKELCPSYSEDERIYQLIINKLSDISDKLSPFFYWRDSPKVFTAMIAYVREYWDELNYKDDDLINNFYESLRNVQRLKRFLYINYISESCPDVIDITTYTEFRNEIFSSDLPNDMKLYLIDFLLYGESEIEFVISEMKKVQVVCEELYKINSDVVNELINRFNDNKIDILSNIHAVDILKYSEIYFTYCVVYRSALYGEYHENEWISFLGIKSEDILSSYNPNIDINLYELGRILYDETRLKILSMLNRKEMYCAEIAKELGLKNNSTLYHLIMMEKQQLIIDRKQGKKILYRINKDYLNSVKNLIDNIITGGSNEK